MTGIPEGHIASYACEYEIDPARVEALVGRGSPALASEYEWRNVRALFHLAYDKLMFVDAAGAARLGSKYLRFDKSDVAGVFSRARPKRC